MLVRSNRRIVASSLAGCCLAALSVVATPAFAQDEPVQSQPAAEEDQGGLTVTAQRRSERQVDVPVTVTNVSEDQLETIGAGQLSDIAAVSPGLRFDSAANFVQPTIRGIGTAVTTSGGGSNVGIYVDGFYVSNPAVADFQLMNVKSVQVLKGPQGTLFGRNTTGGAILVTTADPSTTTGGELKASYGRFDTQRYQGYVTIGLSDKIAFDVEGLYSKGDGFVRNIITGSRRDGAYENWSVRTGLKFDVSDAVSVLLRYSHSKIDDPSNMTVNIYQGPNAGPNNTNGVGTIWPAPTFTTRPNEVDSAGPTDYFANIDTWQGTIKADLGFADLTSYTQYRTEDSLLVEDLDGTAVPIFLLQFTVKDRTFSQEFLLTSKSEGALQWTAGLFYLNSRDIWTTYSGTPTPTDPYARSDLGGSGTRTVSYAAFADLTYEISPQLFLTAGARYSRDSVEDAYYINSAFSQPPLVKFAVVNVPDFKGSKVTPRVVLRYKPDDRSSIYGSFSKGYKAGILDVGGSTGDRVNPENVSAFEVGYKYDDRRLSAAISAFYYDYNDLQVSLYVNRGGAPSAAIINAAKSRIYGVEGQLSYKFDDHFSLNAGAGWTHARYRDFDNAPIYYRCDTLGPLSIPPAPVNALPPGAPITCGLGNAYAVVPTPLNNVPMQRTPEFTGNIGARYETPIGEAGTLTLSGNLYYTSKFFFGPSGVQFPQKGYENLTLRAQWTDPSDRFTLAVFGENVTNARYRTQVLYNTFGISSVWNKPASWGIEAGFKF